MHPSTCISDWAPRGRWRFWSRDHTSRMAGPGAGTGGHPTTEPVRPAAHLCKQGVLLELPTWVRTVLRLCHTAALSTLSAFAAAGGRWEAALPALPDGAFPGASQPGAELLPRHRWNGSHQRPASPTTDVSSWNILFPRLLPPRRPRHGHGHGVPPEHIPLQPHSSLDPLPPPAALCCPSFSQENPSEELSFLACQSPFCLPCSEEATLAKVTVTFLLLSLVVPTVWLTPPSPGGCWDPRCPASPPASRGFLPRSLASPAHLSDSEPSFFSISRGSSDFYPSSGSDPCDCAGTPVIISPDPIVAQTPDSPDSSLQRPCGHLSVSSAGRGDLSVPRLVLRAATGTGKGHIPLLASPCLDSRVLGSLGASSQLPGSQPGGTSWALVPTAQGQPRFPWGAVTLATCQGREGDCILSTCPEPPLPQQPPFNQERPGVASETTREPAGPRRDNWLRGWAVALQLGSPVPSTSAWSVCDPEQATWVILGEIQARSLTNAGLYFLTGGRGEDTKTLGALEGGCWVNPSSRSLREGRLAMATRPWGPHLWARPLSAHSPESPPVQRGQLHARGPPSLDWAPPAVVGRGTSHQDRYVEGDFALLGACSAGFNLRATLITGRQTLVSCEGDFQSLKRPPAVSPR